VRSVLTVALLLVPLSAVLSAVYARWMRRRTIGQRIRALGPSTHREKAGTPTAGGVVIVGLWLGGVAALIPVAPWSRSTGFVVAAVLWFAGVGLLDDAIALRRRRSAGLTAGGKVGLSLIGIAGLCAAFPDVVLVPQQIPFSASVLPLPPVAGFLLAGAVFLAATNSVNLTDGLDGLAAGVSVLILLGVLLLAPDRGTAAIVLPLIGVLVGFLWTNSHPAGLFLGDVGAFALGGAIAALALRDGASFLLPLLAGVPVLESASVILQVASFRIGRRRLFKMAPLHHHFERLDAPPQHVLPGPDWSEAKVTAAFWISQAVFLGIAWLAAT